MQGKESANENEVAAGGRINSLDENEIKGERKKIVKKDEGN